MTQFEKIRKNVTIPENLESTGVILNFTSQLMIAVEKIYGNGEQRKEAVIDFLKYAIDSSDLESEKKKDIVNFIEVDVNVYIEQLIKLSKMVNKKLSLCCL